MREDLVHSSPLLPKLQNALCLVESLADHFLDGSSILPTSTIKLIICIYGRNSNVPMLESKMPL